MRLLHTADWHLGDRLGRIDRTTDLRKAVERIAEYCREERIDTLIVAGDVFSELARPDGLRDAVLHLRDTFAGFLRGGGTILAVTGNHDNETFCQTLRHAMSLAAPELPEPGAIAAPGRLYLAAEPSLLRLDDRGGGSIQFLLMPFPTPAVFLSGDDARRYDSLGERNAKLRAAFLDRLNGLLNHPHYDRTLHAVLAAHVGVSGADLSNRYHISEEADVVIDELSWPSTFTYVALGHIHKAQAVGGRENVRYCGSIERLDLGESADAKGVVVVDIGKSGLTTPPVVLPLDAAEICRIDVADLDAELPRLKQQYAERAPALVNLNVAYDGDRHHLLDIQRQFEAIFPRWYAREFRNRRSLEPELVLGERSATHFESGVRDYLNENLVNHSEDDRQALLAIAESYMRELAEFGIGSSELGVKDTHKGSASSINSELPTPIDS